MKDRALEGKLPKEVDEVLKRLLDTPPKPHSKKKTKVKRKKKASK